MDPPPIAVMQPKLLPSVRQLLPSCLSFSVLLVLLIVRLVRLVGLVGQFPEFRGSQSLTIAARSAIAPYRLPARLGQRALPNPMHLMRPSSHLSHPSHLSHIPPHLDSGPPFRASHLRQRPPRKTARRKAASQPARRQSGGTPSRTSTSSAGLCATWPSLLRIDRQSRPAAGAMPPGRSWPETSGGARYVRHRKTPDRHRNEKDAGRAHAYGFP